MRPETAPISRFASALDTRAVEASATRHPSLWLLWRTAAPKTTSCPGWSPAVFRPSTRAKANVVEVSFLVFDFDASEPPWEHFDEWDYLAHTTHTHRPDAPRWRLILGLCGPIPAAQWGKHLFEAWELEDDSWRGAADPSRFFYLPPDGCHERSNPGSLWQWPTKPVVAPRPLAPARPIPEPVRMGSGAHPYAIGALRRECESILGAAPGYRHVAIYRASASMAELVAGGAIGTWDVLEALQRAAEMAYGDSWPARQADERRNIECGYMRGLRQPRNPPRR